MDLNDFFGAHHKRPEDPDFWTLSEILLRLDGQIEAATTDDEKEAAWAQGVAEAGIDQEVLSYAGIQRALRMLHIDSTEELRRSAQKQQMLAMLATVWTDGFVMGSVWAQRRN